MSNIINRAAEAYKKTSRVRKKKLCKILISNICLDKIKKLTIRVNHWIRRISEQNFGQTREGGDRTPDSGSEDRCVTTTPLPQATILINVNLISLVLYFDTIYLKLRKAIVCTSISRMISLRSLRFAPR